MDVTYGWSLDLTGARRRLAALLAAADRAGDRRNLERRRLQRRAPDPQRAVRRRLDLERKVWEHLAWQGAVGWELSQPGSPPS